VIKIEVGKVRREERQTKDEGRWMMDAGRWVKG